MCCCNYEIIFITIIIIIDIYNRNIKANKDKEDYKKKEEFQQLRKELIDYIYNNYNCLNYNIINKKINKHEQLLKKNNKSLNIKKLLRKIKKELIQIYEKEIFDGLIKITKKDKIDITARNFGIRIHNIEEMFNIIIKQIEFNNELF